MFKRVNKITALLVAAASIMSVVPAMAADRLATKEGTVEKAYAFKDGNYIYQGYRTDDDNKSVYYNAGNKDKELDDLSDATLTAKFGTSSAIAWDGSDEYLVDLSNGKVSDEDLASDTQSTASDKLKSKLKKTDRYGNSSVVINSLTQVAPNQFGDVWYQYSATSSGAALYGYTDKAGKYVDASKTANIRVFTTSTISGASTTGKMVKIDEFDSDATEGIKADLDTTFAPVTLAQDADNLYRVIKVNFTTAAGVTVYDAKGQTPITTQYYVQKVSKAQGDKEKDAYLPKYVESYDLTNTTDEGDVDTAYTQIMNAAGIVSDSHTFVGARVIDGIMYVTEMDSSTKVKTYKIKFNKNLKLDATKLGGGTVKVDAYAMKKDGDKDQDVKGNAGAAGVSIDIEGNVWVINEGKILKSTKAGDFKTMFTCDRSLDSLDVYNDGSLVAWDASGDVYTTVKEGKKQAEDEAPLVTPAKVGWDKLADGTWNLYDATGTKLANKWANVGGAWYFLKADGAMATGWYNNNGTWYFLNGSGAMITGWVNVNGTWYFLNSSGAMATGWVNVNGSWYYLSQNAGGPQGSMKTGWLNDNGTWYYLSGSGAMLANTTVNGYKLGANGAWIR